MLVVDVGFVIICIIIIMRFCTWACFVRGFQRIFGDLSVTIAQWLRARHIRKLVFRKVPGSIPVENTSPQIHMDLST